MKSLLELVHSMGVLMEAGLEDGEDPMVIGSDYVNVVCQVTSSTGALDFETGEWRWLPVRIYFKGPQLQFAADMDTKKRLTQREEILERGCVRTHRRRSKNLAHESAPVTAVPSRSSYNVALFVLSTRTFVHVALVRVYTTKTPYQRERVILFHVFASLTF